MQGYNWFVIRGPAQEVSRVDLQQYRCQRSPSRTVGDILLILRL